MKCLACGENHPLNGLPCPKMRIGDQAPEDARMDLIARNGNGGEHYELSRPATPANYLSLQAVLDEAFNQAAFGKGAERHAQSKPFEEQPMQKLIELYGIGFALGQAGKKMQEAQRMEVEPAVRELLGAINYIAGVVVHLEKPMADDIDLACEQEEKHRQAALASHKPVELDPGNPGECDCCGEYFGRLVGGACGFCRDKYKLP